MKLKTILKVAGVGVVLAGACALYDGVYTLPEIQQAVITRLGKPKRVAKKAGLHLKLPFIETVHKFEKRILEWDEAARDCPTLDKEYVTIDSFARWQVADPLKFFLKVRDERGAQTCLDDIIYSAIRDVVSDHNFIEIVRYTNREITTTEVGAEGSSMEHAKIEKGREKLLATITQRCDTAAREKYGVSVIDVRIKRADLPPDVSKQVYERMKSERKRMGDKYRSEGEGERLRIQGEKELKEKGILSTAYKKAKIIEGIADAKAVDIYADAYNKDPGFYEFMKTLELYEKSLNGNTKIIFSTKARFLRLLKDMPKLEDNYKPNKKD